MLDIDIKQRLGSFNLNIKTTIPTRGVSAIFGPSASGKSTLLNIIAGFNLPDNLPGNLPSYLPSNSQKNLQDRPQDNSKNKSHTNSIIFNNQPWLKSNGKDPLINHPIHKRRIAYVTQAACLFTHLNVQKNLEYAIRRRSNNNAIDFDDICTRLKIHTLLNKFPQHLSGGEQQRVAIARALLSSPELILFDEPLSALDENHREEILHHLEQLHQAFEIPILYVTHNLEELMRLADHVLLLDNGQLIANRPVGDILSDLNLPLSQHQNSGVIIEGSTEQFDSQYQLHKINLGNGLHLWASGSNTNTNGQSKIRIRVYAKDVSITLQAATNSSILNILPATITEISEVQNGQAIVKLNCDNHLLLSRVTAKSIQQLGLIAGQSVFAQIKGIALLGAA